MEPAPATITVKAIRTPRAAALAGIVFSLLFGTSVVLTEWALPPGSPVAGTWIEDDTKRAAVSLSLNLLPFAGIAFLWFIGVMRDRIGAGEDRFFATVFLGSGLLFVAMFFVAGAMAAGIMRTAVDAQPRDITDDVWTVGRHSATSLAGVYGMRMAAVFTISATTIAARLRLVPRWLAMLGYSTAVVLLIGPVGVAWTELAFPGWVLVLSVHVLIAAFARDHADEAGLR